jgi:hypothetical protein
MREIVTSKYDPDWVSSRSRSGRQPVRSSVVRSGYPLPAGAAISNASASGGTARVTRQPLHSKVRNAECAPKLGDVRVNCISPAQ